MGLCHDFGPQIGEGCSHPMRPGSDSCTCEACGVVCRGRFDGCNEVWNRGPLPIHMGPATPDPLAPAPMRLRPAANGHEPAVAPIEARATENDSPAPAAAGAAGATGAVEAVGVGKRSSGRDQAVAEGALEALRQEVDGLRTALAHEQALVATLLARPTPEAGPDVEELRTIIDAAIRTAVKRESVALGDTMKSLLEGVRRDMTAVREANEDGLDGLRKSVDEVAASTSAMDGIAQSTESSFAELKAAVAKLAGASATFADELGRRDDATQSEFQSALANELQPIIEVVAESVAQADIRLTTLDEKVDALTESTTSLADAVAEMIETLGDHESDERPHAIPGHRASTRSSPSAARASPAV